VFRQYGIETDHYLLEKNWTKNQMVWKERKINK
jgi:hypothetical protein